MDSKDRTERAAREFSVVFTGQKLSLPAIQTTINKAGLLGEYNLVRSGTQFTLTAELPENVDFDTAITRLANILGGRVGGVTAGTNPYAVIRVDPQHRRSLTANARDRLRTDSGPKIRTSQFPDQLSPPPASPPPVPIVLSGAEGASLPSVLRQSEPVPEPEHPVDLRGVVSFRIAVGRLTRGVKFILLAVLTGLAVVLEPFTRTETGEPDDDSRGNNQQKDRKGQERDITE